MPPHAGKQTVGGVQRGPPTPEPSKGSARTGGGGREPQDSGGIGEPEEAVTGTVEGAVAGTA